jgi:ubiquitin C-terminal hydrolase
MDVLLLATPSCNWLEISFEREVVTTPAEELKCANLMGCSLMYAQHKKGRQDARRGMRMVSLPPPVLQFHFKRFAYDASTGGMRKINDHFEFPTFEFPTVLDMRKWVTGNQLDTSSTTYALRAIVMHQGGPDRGHYYAYVRPSGETITGLRSKIQLYRR